MYDATTLNILVLTSKNKMCNISKTTISMLCRSTEC